MRDGVLETANKCGCGLLDNDREPGDQRSIVGPVGA